MADSISDKLIAQLVYEEGIRLSIYKCTAGHHTIGIGHNLDSKPVFKGSPIGATISEQLAFEILRDDIADTINNLNHYWSKFSTMPLGARRDAIINMCFQLGINTFLKFKATIMYLEHGQYENASVAALNSKWATEDSPERAARVARQLSSNIYYGVPNAK